MSNIEEYLLISNDECRTNLANVVVFIHSKKTVVNWCIGNIKSIVVYDNLEDFQKISWNVDRRLIKIEQQGPYINYCRYRYNSNDNL